MNHFFSDLRDHISCCIRDMTKQHVNDDMVYVYILNLFNIFFGVEQTILSKDSFPPSKKDVFFFFLDLDSLCTIPKSSKVCAMETSCLMMMMMTLEITTDKSTPTKTTTTKMTKAKPTTIKKTTKVQENYDIFLDFYQLLVLVLKHNKRYTIFLFITFFSP